MRRFDKVHSIIGEIGEGWETIEAINATIVGSDFQPLEPVVVKAAHVLDDPTPPIIGLVTPPPEPDLPNTNTIAEESGLNDDTEKMAELRALGLALMGDIPSADVKPAENVAFVCRLNPHTHERDLRILFGRFGGIKRCDVITDEQTGESLGYGFITFNTAEDCVAAI
jgi:peptidyl-prolyl cis-trans isomerase-like 4